MATFQIIGTIVLVACALGIFYGMFKMSRHDRKDNNGNNHFKSKGTQHKLLAVLLLLIAMGLGQSAWATTVGLSQCGNRTTTAGLSAGVYVLRLIDGKDVKTQKIVIQ